MGRPPTSTEQHLANGTYRADRHRLMTLNPTEPPPPPDWLTATARGKWDETAKLLAGSGVLTALDLDALAAYCSGFATWRTAIDTVEREGQTYESEGGLVKAQPASGPYDASVYFVSGRATGVQGEDLSGLLDLGTGQIDAGHNAVNWTFTGNNDYNPANGASTIDISQATQIASIKPVSALQTVFNDTDVDYLTGSHIQDSITQAMRYGTIRTSSLLRPGRAVSFDRDVRRAIGPLQFRARHDLFPAQEPGDARTACEAYPRIVRIL